RFSRPRAGNGTDRGGGSVAPSGAVASDLANELREDDARYRAVVETAGDGIVSADADGVITSFNQAAERMFGYTRDEAVGRPLTILMPERFHDAHRAGLQRFIATGERHLIGRAVVRCQSLWRSQAIEAYAFRAVTRQTTFRRGEGLPGRVWESCRPAWIADVQLDENFPRRPAAAEDGLHAAIALPLTSGGQFI